MIYLDYNATTPCDEQVVTAMLPYFTAKFGNAASKTHAYGWIADEAVEQARAQVAGLIGAEKEEIVFTSGATEACNLAIKGIFELFNRTGLAGKKHIITCATEHKAVLDTCAHLERSGAEITYLGVDEQGNISLGELEASIQADTLLIAIMYANNESGVVHPIAEISKIARSRKVIFFTDATQAVGKISVDVNRDGIDVLSLSAHKIYGPKGAGALYLRRKGPRVRLLPQIDGGGHENGFRSGTLNVPGIVGLGKAASICQDRLEQEEKSIELLRNELECLLLQVPGASINGAGIKRLPNVCNIAFEGIKAERLIAILNTKIAFSVGSACTSVHKEPSHVLQAMGRGTGEIESAIRLSLGRFTTRDEVQWAAGEIIKGITSLKEN